jgi:hypothetical protein
MRHALLLALGAVTAGGVTEGQPPWRKIDVDPGSPFEAVGVADIDGDGRLDLFSGEAWYRAPRWTRHKVRDVPSQKDAHYRLDFGDVPLDVNGDGRIDFITCTYETKMVGWIEHPADPTQPWVTHEIDRPGSSETCRVVDVDGDGRPDVLSNTVQALVWYQLVAQKPKVEWRKHVVDATPAGAGHGVGVGDVDGDGRLDLIGQHGWHEQPRDPTQPWRFHAEFELGRSAGVMILARDVDGDGLTDLVWGLGHDHGVYWLRQSRSADGTRVWTRAEIDAALPLAHTLLWADLDGAGSPALLAGTRIYAHERDPGATEPPAIRAYRFDRSRRAWSRQTIYQGAPARERAADAVDRQALDDFPRGTAGTGLDMAVADIDGDGDLDLICPGKSGLYLFENPRRAPRGSAPR